MTAETPVVVGLTTCTTSIFSVDNAAVTETPQASTRCRRFYAGVGNSRHKSQTVPFRLGVQTARRADMLPIMRIIAGRFRRRKLQTNPGNTTRPIIDRAKVMLFDRIRDRLPGAKVADLFCGTGTLGLEALSRGAKSVVCAERDHRAYELLRQNVAMLGAEAETLCWRVDLARCSFQPKGDIAWTPYDVIFFDPPYAEAESIRPGDPWYRSLQQLGRPHLSSPGALLVLRSSRLAEPQLPPVWQIQEVHEIASMKIILAERKDASDTDPESSDTAQEPSDTDLETGISADE